MLIKIGEAANYDYITKMSTNRIVQFVFFETKLDSEKFIIKWQEYAGAEDFDRNVTMQQSVKSDGFRYLVQHRCTSGDFKFVFTKSRRTPRVPEVEISSKLVGGYYLLKAERKNNLLEGESKVFAFLTDPTVDLEAFRRLPVSGALNIYEAYYENCRFSYILEFFVKNEFAEDLMKLLNQPAIIESGFYKECVMQLI